MTADLERREHIAKLVGAALANAGLAITPIELDTALRNADQEGARLFERDVILHEDAQATQARVRGCFALGISAATLHRVTGLGAWQAHVLAGEDAARAGALFNLGIVLFDAALDRGGPDVRADALAFTLSNAKARPQTSEFAFFQFVANRFLTLAGNRVDLAALERLLAAEHMSAAPLATARALRTKSVGPFLAMADLGRGSSAMGRVFGRAVWIVDDLWDWDEDRLAGTGRPWLRGGDPDEIVRTELRCLDVTLRATRGWPDSVRHCLAVTLAAWIRMPRPLPLFAEPQLVTTAN